MTPELIEREIAALGLVEAALRDERAALEARDAAALLAATDRKSAALAAAAALTSERQALAGDAPLPTDTGPQPGAATLRTLARRCRELNDANGVLIRAQRQRVEGLLTVLTGSPAAIPATYQPDGTPAAGRRAPRGPLATA
jgi:flagellar biosynthesis/type III secretory pathway chaperone